MMIVSDEMAGRFAKRLIQQYGFTVSQAADALDVMAELLDEVPDPGPLTEQPAPKLHPAGLSGPEALRLRIGYERYKARAELAEATLQRVRDLLDSGFLSEAMLRAILGDLPRQENT